MGHLGRLFSFAFTKSFPLYCHAFFSLFFFETRQTQTPKNTMTSSTSCYFYSVLCFLKTTNVNLKRTQRHFFQHNCLRTLTNSGRLGIELFAKFFPNLNHIFCRSAIVKLSCDNHCRCQRTAFSCIATTKKHDSF